MEILFLISAIPIGLMCGAIPTVGLSLILIMMYPSLHYISFDILLAFYTVALVCQYFSNSVVALWAGITGDPTSFPIVMERQTIIKQNELGAALKRTAQASALACFFGMTALFLLVSYIKSIMGFFLASLSNAFLMITILLIAVFWPKNKIWQNLLLVIMSVIVGLIGYHSNLDMIFLTFGNSDLYSGIPLLPVILGVYAMPLLWVTFVEGIELFKNRNISKNIDVIIPKENVTLAPTIRGGIIGFFMGLVPLVGTSFSSNVAHFFESKISVGDKHALNRVTAAECANNSGAMSVLAPLLILGVAIVPSEMVLVSVLNDRGWTASDIQLSTYLWMAGTLFASIGIVYRICVRYSSKFISLVQNYQMFIVIFFVLFLITGLWISGGRTLQSEFTILIFAISVSFGFLLQWIKINPIPFIIGYIIASVSVPIFTRVFSILEYYMLTLT